ncbi:MAG: hypothetical protein EXR93_01555 [Gemmatimonadetes bacterium]|nr:hypothetical protein [Gemmatimonadota bacterium]
MPKARKVAKFPTVEQAAKRHPALEFEVEKYSGMRTDDPYRMAQLFKEGREGAEGNPSKT